MTDIITKETTTSTDAGSKSDTPKNPEPVEEKKAGKSQTLEYIIYFIFGIIEILLIFRFVFKLTGANPISSFVSSIYAFTQLFIAPFAGIFPQATATGAVTTAVLEPATVVAIIVYAVLAWGITYLVVIMSGRVH